MATRFSQLAAGIVSLLLCMTGFPLLALAGQPLVIFAASSLTGVMTELAGDYEKDSGQETVFSFAATSVLARQIKDGAPAHVFVSANALWMDNVIAAGAIIPDSRTVIAGNRLILAGAPGIPFPPVTDGVVPTDYPLSTVAPDLSFAIGDPAHVPAGIYAHQTLQYLGLWEGIKDRLTPMPDVRSVIANIERGEVAGGFVYASDRQFFTHTQMIGVFPDAAHDPIQYVAGIVTDRQTPVTEMFLSFLVSPGAISVFGKYGFLPPSP